MKQYEERLKNMDPDMLEFEKRQQERLKIEMRMPATIKIDDYHEKFKEIRYNYDFGDDWHFIVKLEKVVEDYYFGYPTLLDGAETAPPDSNRFREYDPDWINRMLKGLNYKKTEWDKINHERYSIIEDKYRKNC